jgi:uncharacterized protein (DUF433 family)
MRWEDYIERVPGIMLGKPVFKGTRFTVEFLLERLADGATEADLLANHPTLTRDQIRAALAYAAAMIRNDEAVLNV